MEQAVSKCEADRFSNFKNILYQDIIYSIIWTHSNIQISYFTKWCMIKLIMIWSCCAESSGCKRDCPSYTHKVCGNGCKTRRSCFKMSRVANGLVHSHQDYTGANPSENLHYSPPQSHGSQWNCPSLGDVTSLLWSEETAVLVSELWSQPDMGSIPFYQFQFHIKFIISNSKCINSDSSLPTTFYHE